jgi:hypothetical protein
VQCVTMCVLRESINCLESDLGHFQFSVKKTGSSECVVVNVMDLMNEVWRHRKMRFERNNSLGRNILPLFQSKSYVLENSQAQGILSHF